MEETLKSGRRRLRRLETASGRGETVLVVTFFLMLAIAAAVTLSVRTERMRELQAQIDELRKALDDLTRRMDAGGEA